MRRRRSWRWWRGDLIARHCGRACQSPDIGGWRVSAFYLFVINGGSDDLSRPDSSPDRSSSRRQALGTGIFNVWAMVVWAMVVRLFQVSRWRGTPSGR